ncbi:hypothetical protein QE152_g15896 [Popillia japonica]|uniref:Uncharacterized protein n=1 Tax=Popillia japonica TaxID=7064 RepID=A0AAW1L491_POPJA
MCDSAAMEEVRSDEILRKIIQLHRRTHDLQRGISEKIDILMNKIKGNDRDDREKLIENLKSDYNNCAEKLKLKGIIVNKTNLIDTYEKYKDVCLRNDEDKTNLFKQIYEIDKSTTDLRRRFHIFCENLNKAVEKTEKSEKDLHTNLLLQGFAAEEKLYLDVLKVLKEETAYREKLLKVDIDAEAANESQITVKDCNVLNNGKVDDKQPKTAQTLKTGRRKLLTIAQPK